MDTGWPTLRRPRELVRWLLNVLLRKLFKQFTADSEDRRQNSLVLYLLMRKYSYVVIGCLYTEGHTTGAVLITMLRTLSQSHHCCKAGMLYTITIKHGKTWQV